MNDKTINDLIEVAMSDCMYITRPRWRELEAAFPARLVERLRAIQHDAESNEENAWTAAPSLQSAIDRIEPRIRAKYPDLNDRSIYLVFNHAAFAWK